MSLKCCLAALVWQINLVIMEIHFKYTITAFHSFTEQLQKVHTTNVFLGSPHQQCSLSQTDFFLQDMPMKPSQPHNKLPPRPIYVRKLLLKERSPNRMHSRRESSVFKQSSTARSGERTFKSWSGEKQSGISTSCSSAGQAVIGEKHLPDHFQKKSSILQNTQPGSPQIGNSSHSSPISQCKSVSMNAKKGNSKVDSKTSTLVTKSANRHTVEQNKPSRQRRPTVIHDDIDELFTPDCILSNTSVRKPPKPSTEAAKQGSTTSPGLVSSTVKASSIPLAHSPFSKAQNVAIPLASSGLATTNSSQEPIASQSRTPAQFNLQNGLIESQELKISQVSTTTKQLKIVLAKLDKNTTASGIHKKLKLCMAEHDDTPKSAGPSNCPPSISPGRQEFKAVVKCENQEDSLDMELGIGLSFQMDLPSSHSSHSSDEDPLLPLHEMMARIAKPPDTPEKGAFPSPSTPVFPSPKTHPPISTTKPAIYNNNLDQMLQEINKNRRSREIETQLLNACKEDLSAIAEYEKTKEEDISPEQQEFLQRFALVSNGISDVCPGEVVFNLETFGHIFNQHSLQLRGCNVSPQNTAQKTLLWSSHAQLICHISDGLFQEAFDYSSPCPPKVSRFLFKMMSVHSDKLISDYFLMALCEIAINTAQQKVSNGNQMLAVWVPSVADVALVLLNMGVPFVTLFPFEHLQPPFTEGDLLEDIFIINNDSPRNSKQSRFPAHNLYNILKYLAFCVDLCPRAYTDYELLLLLTIVSRLGLDTHLTSQPKSCLDSVLLCIIRNFKDWETMMPKICLALTNLTVDHHNMCSLVHLLPYSQRGNQLSKHLSLCMISKLLDGSSTYRPTGKEFMLSDLRPYLPRLQPSALLKDMRSSTNKLADMALLDQQAYYLCHSLLTLANEASNFQYLQPDQKEHLLIMCDELERYVKGDIRESDKQLYRSKVKDLVARIYTKWQMLLRSTRPLHGKLYDYWAGDALDISEKVEKTMELD